MVTSFMKEDRERTKHESLLLNITQRSIEERTKVKIHTFCLVIIRFVLICYTHLDTTGVVTGIEQEVTPQR